MRLKESDRVMSSLCELGLSECSKTKADGTFRLFPFLHRGPPLQLRFRLFGWDNCAERSADFAAEPRGVAGGETENHRRHFHALQGHGHPKSEKGGRVLLTKIWNFQLGLNVDNLFLVQGTLRPDLVNTL